MLMQDYASSLCLAAILVSKITHLDFHYTYEPFTFRDAAFMPSFFALDVLIYSIIRWCISYGVHLGQHSKSRLVSNVSKRPLSHVLFCLCWIFSLLVCFFATVEFSVYVGIGGLCSWEAVVEIFAAPSYLLIFWQQWMSTKQTLFVLAIPAAVVLLTRCVHSIIARWSTSYGSYRFTSSKIAFFLAAALSGSLLQAAVRPRPSLALVVLSCIAWGSLVSHVLRCTERPAWKRSSLPISLPMSEKERWTASTSLRKTIMVFVLVALINIRPRGFHDISITVPTSVAYSLLGITPDHCPVGKGWPSIPKTPRADLLPCQGLDCTSDSLLLSTNFSSYWPSDNPPRGFEMFSAQRHSDWVYWASANEDAATQPSSYYFLFDEAKISNLDQTIHAELLTEDTGDGLPLSRVKILIVMESTPSHLFPFGPHSPYYSRTKQSQQPMKSYDSLYGLTPNADRLFGKVGCRCGVVQGS